MMLTASCVRGTSTQQEALALWNGQVNEACAVAYGAQRWQCYFSPVGTKYLKTRFFMHTEQFDAFQVTCVARVASMPRTPSLTARCDPIVCHLRCRGTWVTARPSTAP